MLAVVAATTILALGSPSNAQSEPALSFVVPLQEPVPLELSTDDSATGGRLARLNVMLRDNIEVTTSGWTPEASARPRRATIAVGGPR